MLFEVLRDQMVIWNVICGRNATSLTFPDPPSMVDPAIFLGSGALQGSLKGGVIDWQRNKWIKYTRAEYLSLTN